MPIDYSKFDHIGSDDEDNVKAPRNNFEEIMQECRRRLGDQPGGAGCPDPGYALDPGDLCAPDPFAEDPMRYGFDGGESGERPLDFESLRKEASQRFLTRLISQPGAAGTARALLLEAELDLLACRYHEALVGALAIKLATCQGSAAPTPSGGPRQLARLGGAPSPPEEWATPALVIEMVAAYQLGDRDHAVAVRDRLEEMGKDSLSAHLKKRFEGTSEILELVPQFLSLLKATDDQGSVPIEGDGTRRGR